MDHRNAGEHVVANVKIAKWTTGMPEIMWLQMPKLQNGPLFFNKGGHTICVKRYVIGKRK